MACGLAAVIWSAGRTARPVSPIVSKQHRIWTQWRKRTRRRQVKCNRQRLLSKRIFSTGSALRPRRPRPLYPRRPTRRSLSRIKRMPMIWTTFCAWTRARPWKSATIRLKTGRPLCRPRIWIVRRVWARPPTIGARWPLVAPVCPRIRMWLIRLCSRLRWLARMASVCLRLICNNFFCCCLILSFSSFYFFNESVGGP